MTSPVAPFAADDSRTYTSTSSTETTTPIDRPPNVVENDLMVALIERAFGSGSITAPTDWNLIGSLVTHDGGSTAVYEKVAGASEPSSYTWDWVTGGSRNCGAIQRVTGADTTTPIAANASTTSADTIDPPNADPGSSDDHLAVVFVGQEGKTTTFTVSTGYTENVDGIGTSGGGSPALHCSGYIESREYNGQA